MVRGTSNQVTTTSASTMNQKKKMEEELPLVGESILKKRHDLDELVRKRAALEEIEPKRRRGKGATGTNNNNKKKKFYVMKPETIFAHCRNQRNQQRRLLRVQKKGMQTRASTKPILAEKVLEVVVSDNNKANSTADEKMMIETTTIPYQANSIGAKMVFVIRIRDSVATPKSILNILHNTFQLRNVNDGIFVRYSDNDRNRQLLHMIDPYVVYGPIGDSSIVQDLIVRRGHAKIINTSTSTVERVPISNNVMIEQEFQNNPKYNNSTSTDHILCIEDLVHEIYTVGSAFDIITKDFLYPFSLSNAKTEYEQRTLRSKDILSSVLNGNDDTKDDGDNDKTKKQQKHYGDIGHLIQDYIQQVL